MCCFSGCDGRSHIMESSRIFHKVHIRNNSLGNCQFKFLKFSLKDFYDFSLTSVVYMHMWLILQWHVIYASLWDKWIVIALICSLFCGPWTGHTQCPVSAGQYIWQWLIRWVIDCAIIFCQRWYSFPVPKTPLSGNHNSLVGILPQTQENGKTGSFCRSYWKQSRKLLKAPRHVRNKPLCENY